MYGLRVQPCSAAQPEAAVCSMEEAVEVSKVFAHWRVRDPEHSWYGAVNSNVVKAAL